MKKRISFLSLLLLLVSCSAPLQPESESQPSPEPQTRTAAGLVFYASFEDQSAPGTKVFMNDSWQLCWNAQDQISVFNQTDDNLPFVFSGADGDASGSFSPVDASATLAGTEVPSVYAVYPYAAGTTVSSGGAISLTLPAEQAYGGGVSFGRGANTMVSVTASEKDKLLFRNVCGYLQLKLYGDDVAISRVTFSGNNGELLAGPASVTASADGVPSVSMQSGATTDVSVVCAEPVALGADAEHYTTFMLAIPPTTFEKGFTITVTDSDGYVVEKSTSNNYTIGRNEIFSMAPVKCREIETFQIENVKVRDYMTHTYTDFTGNNAYTVTYVPSGSLNGYDKPLPFTLSVTGAKEVRMKSLSARYPREWTVSVSNSIQIYNLIPGVVYHYEVCNAAGTTLKSGFVRPEGQVRMINGFSYNVRDMGGWQATGGTIAYGKLYRGAELDGRIDEAGKTIFFNDLGISIDLDLRRNKDDHSEKATDPLGLGANGYTNIQVLKFFDNGTGNTCELYQQAIREIIGWLGQNKRVYLHCVGGADRTGTLAFLIEALVGVSESDLSKDYELTNFDGSHVRKRNATSGSYIFTYLINYLRKTDFGGYSGTINQNVENWAKFPFSDSVAPLSDDEIALLRQYLVVTE